MITKKEFDSLEPFDRGYVVYMLGQFDDEPHVPQEKNPYEAGTLEHHQWLQGGHQAWFAETEMKGDNND